MRVSSITLPLTVVLLISLFGSAIQKETLSADNDICRLFADGAKLRKPGSCSIGIECKNSKSVDVLVCSGTTAFYDRLKGTCVKSTSDTYCKAPCKKTSPKYVVDPKNCNGWYECNGSKEVKRGNCPDGMHFDQKNQICNYSDQLSCSSTYEFCDVVPANIPFKDEANCHKYFECPAKGTKIETVVCPTGLYYVAALGECIAKAQVDCYKHPYPEEVCGNSKIALRNRFVTDEATCRGYFYCKDLGVGKPDSAPIWGQCSVSEFFDQEEEACKPRAHVKCSEDRCDGRGDGRALSERKGCQYYYECVNDYTLSEEYCGDKLYFDEVTETCTSTRKEYSACKN
ncbi:peritrophin-48-like [Teleopsis dalmanni]|uniref:peritrophin-48-like n=1 Tax=Teleopsis dalmanni TaxID=139649 RepID=UPI0018CF6C05|nr:peritrophin-48-like [Teleopsis dalmanni]